MIIIELERDEGIDFLKWVEEIDKRYPMVSIPRVFSLIKHQIGQELIYLKTQGAKNGTNKRINRHPRSPGKAS